jgi:hypothetical protein
MSRQPLYGYPCVSNPNDFDPDPECCSQTEIEAHRIACANFGKASYEPNKGCVTEVDESGALVRHILRTSWGIGVNLIASCDDCAEPSSDLMTCHECGGQEFCPVCWPRHEKRHDDGDLS